jgi:hypothetical protein
VIAARRPGRGPRAARLGWVLAVATLGFAGAANVAAEPAANDPPAFFDPLATIAPGITREVGLLFDHTRSPDARLTVPSLRLQLPVSSWLQFSVEMPVVLFEPSEGSATVGAGDGNLSYQWVLDGPLAYSELLQVTVAGGYRLRWIAPFAELALLKAVRGPEDLRPQVSVLPGVEFFLPWNLSLSVGVQLTLGPARFFDQRVLSFLKWQF